MVKIIFFLFPFFAFAQEVTIIKQWHLSPGANTENIFKSKEMPQFQNQKDIYEKLADKTLKGPVTVITEGCAGEVKKTNHYGWSEEKLKAKISNADYPDILAFLPLKLTLKFPDKVVAVCADDDVLMKQNQIAFSDIRGFLGYYTRLKEFKGKDQKKFELYEKSLFEKEKEKIGKVDAVKYAQSKAVEKIEEAKGLIERRNEKIMASIEASLSSSPYVIVGGLHAKGLSDKLKSKQIKFSIVTPSGYQEKDEKLFDELTALLH